MNYCFWSHNRFIFHNTQKQTFLFNTYDVFQSATYILLSLCFVAKPNVINLILLLNIFSCFQIFTTHFFYNHSELTSVQLLQFSVAITEIPLTPGQSYEFIFKYNTNTECALAFVLHLSIGYTHNRPQTAMPSWALNHLKLIKRIL